MKILALDPAAKCGWAHSNGQHGIWNLGTGRPLDAQHRTLADHLKLAIADWGCELIACENAGFGSHNPNVQAMHNERLGVIRLVAAQHGIELVAFNPMSIKAYATGSGKADKRQMMQACQRFLKVIPIDDNDCDAIWILHLASNPKHWPQPAAKKPRAKAFRTTKAANKAGRLF